MAAWDIEALLQVYGVRAVNNPGDEVYTLDVFVNDDHPDTPLLAKFIDPRKAEIDGQPENGTELDVFGIWMIAGFTRSMFGTVDLSGNMMQLWKPHYGTINPISINFTGGTIENRAEETGLHFLKMSTTFGIGVNNYTIAVSGRPTDIGGNDAANALNRTAQVNVLRGLAGNDRLRDEAGWDLVLGGPGFDALADRLHADVFEFRAGVETQFAANQIMDYEIGSESIVLFGFGIGSTDDLEFVPVA